MILKYFSSVQSEQTLVPSVKGLALPTMNNLEIVTFGVHYVEIALLLRELMFINGIRYNSEVWYGLSRAKVSDLDT